MKTKGGAEFDSEELRWSGKSVYIAVDSMNERRYESLLKMIVETGSVRVTTTEKLNEFADEKQKRAEEAASKL